MADNAWLDIKDIVHKDIMQPPIYSLTGLQPVSLGGCVNIDGKIYQNVIAARYDGYSTYTYLYIDSDNGLRLIVNQKNCENAQPMHYELLAIEPHVLNCIACVRKTTEAQVQNAVL